MSKLHERAMLVTLSISNWGATQRDRKKSEEVAQDENAQRDAGSWVTQLVSKKDLEGVTTASSRARALHNGMTLPWNDSGTRILPSARFMEYREAMSGAKEAYFDEIEKLIDRYPDLISQLSRRLGGLERNAKIPTAGELRTKFGWNCSFLPLPDTKDFRTDLQDDAADEIRKNIEANFRGLLKEAQGDTYKRIGEAVEKIAVRTKDSDAILRVSIFETVRELVAEIPKMNITDDPELDAIGKEILAKLAVDPGDLRDDKVKRARVAKDASDILKRVQSYTGPIAQPAQQPSQTSRIEHKTTPKIVPSKPAAKAKKGPTPKPMTAAEIAKQSLAFIEQGN